jgi:hypothetical protein
VNFPAFFQAIQFLGKKWASVPPILRAPLGMLLVLLPMLPFGRYLLPLLAPALIYPEFSRALRNGNLARAFWIAILWAFCFSAVLVFLAEWNYPKMEAGVLFAKEYREEMFSWLATGRGREGDWRQFLPQHLLHLGVFVFVARVFGGYLALALGSFLIAYMSVFVAAVALASHRPVVGAVVAWFPWAVCRVVGFVALGTILARRQLLRSSGVFSIQERRWFALAATAILLDWLLKALLAEPYRQLLQGWIEAPKP